MTPAERTRRYYANHRLRILARRRRKYYSDPGVRERMVKGLKRRRAIARLLDRWIAEAA